MKSIHNGRVNDFDSKTKENSTLRKPNCPKTPDQPRRLSVIGDSKPEKQFLAKFNKPSTQF